MSERSGFGIEALDDTQRLAGSRHRGGGPAPGDSRALHDRLCEILVAQDYQDLIGQVIQRVVRLLQEVEAKLATMASLSGSIARQAYPQGDEAEPERSDEEPQARPRILTSQGEVDELLAALGAS